MHFLLTSLSRLRQQQSNSSKWQKHLRSISYHNCAKVGLTIVSARSSGKSASREIISAWSPKAVAIRICYSSSCSRCPRCSSKSELSTIKERNGWVPAYWKVGCHFVFSVLRSPRDLMQWWPRSREFIILICFPQRFTRHFCTLCKNAAHLSASIVGPSEQDEARHAFHCTFLTSRMRIIFFVYCISSS